MEAIILAGGKGTRLRACVSDVPKPMAPIHDRPFLCYLMDFLITQGITKIILATGYMHEVIEQYFGCQYRGIPIIYSQEETPLGTGGSIKKALDKTEENYVLIANGDSLFHIPIQKLLEHHITTRADISLSLKLLHDFDRFGTVELSASRIVQFYNKKWTKTGWINGGIYVVNRNIFTKVDISNSFSFEKDFLEIYVKEMNISGYPFNNFFIDIGIPEDYKRAQSEWSVWHEQ